MPVSEYKFICSVQHASPIVLRMFLGYYGIQFQMFGTQAELCKMEIETGTSCKLVTWFHLNFLEVHCQYQHRASQH